MNEDNIVGALEGILFMAGDAVETADTCVWHLGNLAANLSLAAGDFDGLDGAKNHAGMLGWAAIDGEARAWLADLSANTDTIEAMRDWHGILRHALIGVASRLVADSSPAAVTGRRRARGREFRSVPGLAAGLFESPVLAPLQGAWFVGSCFRGSCSRATPGYDLAPLQGGQVGC